MGYCKNCGKRISAYDDFCKECGAPNYNKGESNGFSLKKLAMLFCILMAADLIYISYLSDKHESLTNINKIKNNIFKTDTKKNPETDKDLFFKNYMHDMQLKIKNNWTPPKYDTSKKTVLFFTVKRSGEVENIRVEKSSGSKDSDDAAIEALKKSSPLAPFDSEIKEEKVDIMFTFDYNVLNAKDKTAN